MVTTGRAFEVVRRPAMALACLAVGCVIGATAMAGPEAFAPGPLIDDYGPHATVPGAAVDAKSVFKVAFDVSEAAEPGETSRRLETAARFLNMHAAAGVPPAHMRVAIVVHGKAAMDLVTDARYGGDNANAALIAALVDAGVTIELCGQTAAYYDIAASDLLPGVRMALSAMTAHALLQQQGYTLNPF